LARRTIAGSRKNRQAKAFLQGVTTAAVGAVASAALILTEREIVDKAGVVIAVMSFGLLLVFKKMLSPF
jgi:chromate transporter